MAFNLLAVDGRTETVRSLFGERGRTAPVPQGSVSAA